MPKRASRAVPNDGPPLEPFRPLDAADTALIEPAEYAGDATGIGT